MDLSRVKIGGGGVVDSLGFRWKCNVSPEEVRVRTVKVNADIYIHSAICSLPHPGNHAQSLNCSRWFSHGRVLGEYVIVRDYSVIDKAFHHTSFSWWSFRLQVCAWRYRKYESRVKIIQPVFNRLTPIHPQLESLSCDNIQTELNTMIKIMIYWMYDLKK